MPNPTLHTTRFAPSPTGQLHLGHAFSALLAAEVAAAVGGSFRLRIEDIDATRCRPEHETGLRQDLAWLGLVWPEPVRRQSEHMADYAKALARLEALGLIYPCFCTRAAIAAEVAASPSAPHGPDGPLYPGTCRHLPPAEAAAQQAGGAPFALRLHMNAALAQAGGDLVWTDVFVGTVAAEPARFGDVVLARKETPTSYHLSVVHDDALEGVSLIIRGRDLFEATHVHRLLQALLGLPVPLYAHHDLLCGPDGRRLAKRDRAETLASLRAAGLGPGDLRARLEPGLSKAQAQILSALARVQS
jgi:glutamyl-Q tRNA(Asp) synthetase